MSARLLFFGTSDFAVPSLTALARDGRFEIVGIVTQPDRPVGRHAELTQPPIKQTALNLGLETIVQPEKIKDESFQEWIKEIGPTCDAFIVVSYGKILPQWLLDLPKHGVVNVHGSLLPRWRGASPIQSAIAAGDEASGITIMNIDALMDHGPILVQAQEEIRPDDIGDTLHDRLAELGGKTLPDALSGYLDGSITPQEQNHEHATPCKILNREDGKIDWTKSAAEIERLIRAYNPWPGTWTEWNGKRLKIVKAIVIEHATTQNKETSGISISDDRRLIAHCGKNTTLELTEVQPEGKSLMTGQEFVNGLRTKQ